MDETTWRALRDAAMAELEQGCRASFVIPPLGDIGCELIEGGYVIAEEMGPLLVLSVTPKGFLAVAH